MGCFSWLYADKDNTRAMNIGKTGYLIFPDGKVEETDGGYDGYGHFGKHDHYDVYEEVADWNREFLVNHPDFTVPQHGKMWDQDAMAYVELKSKKVSEFKWWPFYSDLSLSSGQITAKMLEMLRAADPDGLAFWEYRWIGIALSCYDDQNEKLPYPIKISSSPNVIYENLPASKGDPDQGLGEDTFEEDEDDNSTEQQYWIQNESGKPVCSVCGGEQMCDHGGHYKYSPYCPHCGTPLALTNNK